MMLRYMDMVGAHFTYMPGTWILHITGGVSDTIRHDT